MIVGKMQHRLNSAPLAFLLSGYKCIRQVPTDAYLPKALEIVKSTNELFLELTRASSQKPSTGMRSESTTNVII